eukprot:SAG11_NODE_8455_length_1013_cov_1.400438_2_plen_121_part_01
MLLVLMLAVVFAPVAPMILLPAIIAFGTGYVVHLYLLVYVYEAGHESGGLLWPLCNQCIYLGIIVGHTMLIGVLSLKQGYWQMLAITPLLLCTGAYFHESTKRFDRVAQFLPLNEVKTDVA